MTDSCCPPDRAPALQNPGDYKCVGTEVKFGKLDCYTVGEAKKGAIIVLPDVFGWQSGRHKAICDQFALEGYYAIMPDLFHGDRLFFKDIGKPRMGEFINTWKVEKWTPDMDTVYKHLAEKKISPDSTGMIGFCWGSWGIYHESGRCGGKNFASGANFHPSLVIEKMLGSSIDELAQKATTPMLMAPCKGDPEEVQAKGSVSEILAKKEFGSKCEYHPFPEMAHGFVSQGDLSVKEIAKEVDNAMKAATAFFAKTLK
eukprot:CAMPEP_0197514902 /NCGR_PEP_ID=MMETSP1318-20131121/199_1 /TAXON_ID=552666 /ORGANISM="Partenskyella glossopodia, Strain RCC365" /LENGTH=256 /DNA_ID=CAMNT_0043063121 /DNA_START=50 /DNA_END=820 /DNA_ORIENTATION=+